jgi:hypothetical protein
MEIIENLIMTLYLVIVFVSVALAQHYNNGNTSQSPMDKIEKAREKKLFLKFLKNCHRKSLLKERLLNQDVDIDSNQHSLHYGQPFKQDLVHRDHFSYSDHSTSSSDTELNLNTRTELNLNIETELNTAVSDEY